MTESELQLKITLAKIGLAQDAAGAAKILRDNLTGIDAVVGIEKEKLEAEVKAVEAFLEKRFDDIPIEFQVDSGGKLRNSVGQFVEVTKRQLEQDLKGIKLDVDLTASDKDVKLLNRAISELADEALQAAQQAEFLQKAYNLSDREVEQVIRKMKQLGDETDRTKKSAGGLQGAIAGLAAGAAFAAIDLLTNALQAAGQAFFGFISSTLEVGGAAQQSKVAFNTILGSAEEAEALLSELSEFAATTPFDLPGVRQAGQQLLAFGFESEQVVTNLSRIGDVAAGVNTDFGELANIYGKAKVAGRLYAEDVNQLTERGIPIIQEFAKQFGVTESEVKKLVEQGKIGFPALEEAFVSLTKEGSKFGGLMEAQSKTIPGQIANIKDGFITLQESLTEALEPALAGGLSTISGIIAEASKESAGLDVLAEAAARLQAVLSDSPEVVEEFGGLLADIADAAVNQLALILDAVTAFVSEEGNVEALAGQFNVLVDAINGLGTVVRFVIALADSFAQVKAAAADIPVIGDNLARFLEFPVPFNLLWQTLIGIGEAIVVLKDAVIDAVNGSLESLQKLLPILTPIVDRVQQLLASIKSPEAVGPLIGDGITESLKDAASKLGSVELPTPGIEKPQPTPAPEPPDLSPIEDRYKALTAALEVEQANQTRALVEGGKSREEIEAKERDFLQRRIRLNQQKADELRAVDASSLDPEGREKLADQLLALDQKIAGDQLKLAQDNRKAIEASEAAKAKATEDAEKAKTKAAEDGAKARDKAEQDAEKAAKDRADAEAKRLEEIAKARERQINAIEEEGRALVALGQVAIDSAALQVDRLQRVSEEFDRQADKLKIQGDLLSALGELQGAINDARADGLREIIGDEDASDSKKRKAARDLLALTEQQFAQEKAQLEQKQALELQAFDLGQQQAALAEQRGIKEQELALRRMELQKLEIANEIELARLRGDTRAVQLGEEQLALADEQLALQGEFINSLRESAAISQEIGAGQRQVLVAGQVQEDIGLANQQRGQARSVDDEVSDISRTLDRRGDRLVDGTESRQQRELFEAQSALPSLLASARPNPQVQAMAGLGSIPGAGQINLASFVAPLEKKFDVLSDRIEQLAASPRQLSVSTPDPVADTSKILSDIARQASQGVNP